MKNEAVKFNWWKDKLIELWAQIEWMCVCNSFQLLLWNSVKWLYWQPFSVKHWLVIVIDRLKVSYHQVFSSESQTSSLCQYTQFEIIRFINEIDVHFVVSLQYSIKVRSFKNSFRSLFENYTLIRWFDSDIFECMVCHIQLRRTTYSVKYSCSSKCMTLGRNMNFLWEWLGPNSKERTL